MTPEQFRELALSLPDVSEGAHMGHADFRMNGRIFATLGYPDLDWAMVKLPPEMQEMYVGVNPAVFSPSNGAWGRKGSTQIRLKTATKAKIEGAIRTAWEATRR